MAPVPQNRLSPRLALDGAFQDDGEATVWFKPFDPGEQERTDEDDHRDTKGG